ncbi:enoyl-CoA hydratase/isomerase family protein [Nonomuraea lactucae]|uniref:enoyl-CoA hydratase/isomerase family protein n=1 Tax=Nonomuraea lactucae TaxID=2249762 RepID=UPI000DE3DDD9|nr:enoyl-CoA hydratase/isomerase family protein [Nonomuraea lactucae]
MSADHDDRPVLVSEEGGIVRMTLNRPGSLNALNVPLLRALVTALRAAHGAGPVVIHGAGRAFCAGEDLKQTLAPRTGGPEELRESFEMLQDVTRLMSSNPSPVIAAVHGFAVGGGAEIALAADMVIASPSVRLRFPEVPIGHAHTGGISLRLPVLVGLLKAKELLLTGRWVEGQEAIGLGLANELSERPLERAMDLAARFAAQPPRSMAATKRALEVSTFPQQEAVLRLEVESALHCFASSEAERSFAEFTSSGTVAGAR